MGLFDSEDHLMILAWFI